MLSGEPCSVANRPTGAADAQKRENATPIK